ncbi:MAG: chromate transporter [Clostridia bacterium]|nr:chromate transporter [Clostridia bacterium]
MRELWELISVFLKISIFSFGGGYVMIGYLQHEFVSRGWISANDFANIVSISQMTPGPIGINAATFIGFTTEGYIGALLASVSVVLLPFIMVLLVSVFYDKYKSNKFIQNILKGIRPACVGLIIIVGVGFFETAAVNGGGILDVVKGGALFDIRALVLFAASLFVLLRTKISSIWVMLASLAIGIFLF